MRFKRLALPVLLLAGAVSLQATDLQVHLWSGSQQDYPLEDIRSIVYNPTSGAFEFNLTGGGFDQYPLPEIRKWTFTEGFITEVEQPEAFVLLRNYPNPFNSTTTIEYQLPVDAEVTVAVYNIQGQQVCRLMEGFLPAGLQRFSWNGNSDNGMPVASGVYICRIDRGAQRLHHRMLLLK